MVGIEVGSEPGPCRHDPDAAGGGKGHVERLKGLRNWGEYRLELLHLRRGLSHGISPVFINGGRLQPTVLLTPTSRSAGGTSAGAAVLPEMPRACMLSKPNSTLASRLACPAASSLGGSW